MPFTITRIAHCCVLMGFGETQVLTDPCFSQKPGYHPGEPLGRTLETLPRLSGVLVSHGHYDHNDMNAFSRYPERTVPILAERNAATRARTAGFTQVAALDVWETASLGPVAVTAVPARHGVPEVGYVLESGGLRVYFAGDTVLIPDLSEIGRRFPVIDVALVPINGLKVFGKQVVMNPLEAAELCKLLRPRMAIPTHYAFQGGRIMDSLFLKYYNRQELLP
jgi:L-ascorbate metabolism protein UlaG (beta-lactamase superfamily)